MRWRCCPDFPDYEVSDTGRVRRVIPCRTRTVPYELRGCWKPGSYRFFTIRKDGARVQTKGHVLVARAFIPNPEGKPLVAHDNGRPGDDRVENLYWATYKENTADRLRHGTHQHGERNARAILTEAAVRKIRRTYRGGSEELDRLAGRYGLSRSGMWKVVSGATWKGVRADA